MTKLANGRTVYIVPRRWLGRFVAAVGTITLIFLAVFFFTVFRTVFAILAFIIIARIQQSGMLGMDVLLEYRGKGLRDRQRVTRFLPAAHIAKLMGNTGKLF